MTPRYFPRCGRGAVLGLLVQAAALPPAASAQTPGETVTPPPTDDPAITEARRRYQQGAEFYRRGRYAEAVAEFTEAFSRWPNPTILYSLGQAYEGLSDVNRAIETYRRYLDLAPAADARRAEVEAKIIELERLLATVHVEANVPVAIYVDGELIGAGPGDLRLATGRHELEARAEGYVSATQTVIVAGGTERTLAFTLEPIPVSTTTQIVTVESEPFRFPRPMFFATAGLTGAAGLTWTGLAGLTLSRAHDYNADPDRTDIDRARAREIAHTSNIVLGVGGGLAVVTTVVGLLTDFSTDEEDEEDEDATPAVSAGIEPITGGAIVTARWLR